MLEKLINSVSLYHILCLIGVPSLSTIMIAIQRRLKKYNEENTTIKLGLQALLRSQMINDFNRWSEKGYAPMYARENFENCWQKYHNLGANGVMDDLHNKFMELPTRPSCKIEKDNCDKKDNNDY